MKSFVSTRLKTFGWSIAFFGVFFSFSGLFGGSLAEAEPQLGQAYWRKVSVPHPGQINGVAISPSGQHIVINGDFSLYSSDRGVTWDTADGLVPFIMDYGDESHIFGVASGDVTVGVYRSTDSGKTWLRIDLPDNLIDFREVDFIDSVHGWAVGDKDFIVTTKDGWQTWTTKPYGLPGYVANGVSLLDTIKGYVGGVIGADTAILSTSDGGNSWLKYSLGLAGTAGGRTVNFVDSLHGWLMVGFGNDEHIFTSSDGGQTWIERPTPIHEHIQQFKALDSLNCWAIGDDLFPFPPRVWRTRDGGQSWVIEYNGPADFLQDLDMADTSRGVAVGSSGTVLIYTPVVLGDLNGDEETTSTDIVLELNKVFLDQNFPAPVEAGDVNCDGVLTSQDVVILLNRAFMGTPFPCGL